MNSYKPIKFFLRVGDKSVHDLKDLCINNFHLDKLYQLYQEGILQCWLKAHELKDKVNRLSEFEKRYDKGEIDDERASEFCRIFFPESQPKELEYIIQNFKLEEKWKSEFELMNKERENHLSHIKFYHNGYENLKESIIKDRFNMQAIRSHLKDMSNNYIELFKLDCCACLDSFIEEAPAAVLLIFSNETLRNFVSTHQNIYKEILEFIKDNTPVSPENLQGKRLAPFIFPEEYEKAFDLPRIDNIVSLINTYNKSTDASWEDIEWDKSKKFMILYKNNDSSVRPYKDPENELPKRVTDLPIISGIEYRNNDENNYLIYMEV